MQLEIKKLSITVLALILITSLFIITSLIRKGPEPEFKILHVGRELPKTVKAGSDFLVKLFVNSKEEVSGLVIYEEIPQGLTLADYPSNETTFLYDSEKAIWTSGNRNPFYLVKVNISEIDKIMFDLSQPTYFSNRTIIYKISAPSDARGKYTFRGTYESEQANGTIAGDQMVSIQ